MRVRRCSPRANEWKKTRHFGEKFWLYIVVQAGTDAPQLHRVQNPAVHFQEGQDIFATGFLIPEEKWLKKINKSTGQEDNHG